MIQREIELRGKRFDNGKWAYGNLIIDDSGNCEIIDYENNREIRYDVMGETIGQFTGKYDKNKRKVYEVIGKVTELNKKVLELFNGGKCLEYNGGYCDMCPISKSGTDTCGDLKQRYSK